MKPLLHRLFIEPVFTALNISRRKYRKWRRISSFRGTSVCCTICGSTFSVFGSFGDPKRENAVCLKCGSLERHRLIWKYLQDGTDFNEGKAKRLLHFAPEKFFYEKFRQNPNLDYMPCDLFPEKFEFDKEGIIRKVDITEIPLKEEMVDVILCNHVLEHIPDDRLAMSELYRVLKTGGWGIFQVPIDYSRERTYEDFAITTAEGRKEAFGQDDHVRWYGKDYVNRLISVGFAVKEDNFVATFSADDQYKYGFKPQELIYYCRKE